MGKAYLFATTAFFALACAAHAAETQTFVYDSKGRLVSVSRSGSINNGATAVYSHDQAHNRTAVIVDGTPPPPTPTNQPPVANADNAGSMQQCAIRAVNVIANDTDPENNIPLAVTGAFDGANIYATTIPGNATSIQIESTAVAGVQTVQYQVSDSLGASSIGTVTINVINGSGCGGTALRTTSRSAPLPPPSPPPLVPAPPKLGKGN
jgi:hypothetical protein